MRYHKELANDTQSVQINALVKTLNNRTERLRQKSWNWREVVLRPHEMTRVRIFHDRGGLSGQGRAVISIRPPSPLEKFTCHVDYCEFGMNGATPRYRELSNRKLSDTVTLGKPGLIDMGVGILKSYFWIEFRCTAERAGKYRFEVTPA
ncbi:hypothetical protein [Kordiimonas aestuarii]|uniref:hypothetical protein n=1 Tax=Kordiimonas aestuarii TaxID=1005925 RepID=UPI0021D39D49|nr:hypothetical protein [Kordiimonas aestuarii]